MQIRKVFALLGPNIWANSPVIEAWVDLGRFEALPSNLLPNFTDRLLEWLPSLMEHCCSVGERGGFVQRLRDGTWLGHVLEHVTLELQTLTHWPVGFGRTRETHEPGVYKVVVRCENPQFAEACLETARELILAAAEACPFAIEPELRRLREVADRLCLGPSTRAIVEAARARGIPTLRLTPGNLIQLGYGKLQRRIWTAETDGTQAIAESIAQDKELTRKLLTGVGVPVPKGRQVRDADDAWAAAQELDDAVVVKPQDANHGRGVSIRLSGRDAITAAYELAAAEGTGVIVEQFIPGRQYRVLVVGGEAIAAAGGEVDQVLGDGALTVAELVARENRDPRRGYDSAQLLSTLSLDRISLELLATQELTPASVPEKDQVVLLRFNGDLTVDETDRMHPEVAARCVLAAKTVGLDIAGIDFIAEDIGKPLEGQGGAVIEVNASPSLVMHLKPLTGKPRPVGEAIVNLLFKPDAVARIPILAISGTRGKTQTIAGVATLLAAAEFSVATADARGLRFGQRWLSSTNAANAEQTRRALMNPNIDALVVEVSEASVLQEGLAFDRCQVAAVTNLGMGKDLGQPDVYDLAAVTRAVRAPVDVVLATGCAALNADDPAVVDMAQHCKGAVIFFTQTPASPIVAQHLEKGGRALVLEGEAIFFCAGSRRELLLELGSRTAGASGQLSEFGRENLLTALATLLGVGLELGRLRSCWLAVLSANPLFLKEFEDPFPIPPSL